jgi:hypothetical protein
MDLQKIRRILIAAAVDEECSRFNRALRLELAATRRGANTASSIAASA